VIWQQVSANDGRALAARGMMDPFLAAPGKQAHADSAIDGERLSPFVTVRTRGRPACPSPH